MDSQFDDLKQRFRSSANRLRRDHDCAVNEALDSRLLEMIKYAIERHDWYENQRHRFLQIGTALLALAPAFAAVLVRIPGNFHFVTRVATILGLLSLLVTGVFLVGIYAQMIEADHPYRRLVDIRSWYFRYSLPSRLSAAMPREPEKARHEVESVVQAFEAYGRRWWEFASEPGRFVEEDLEQVFVLHLLQKYRQENLRRMQRFLTNGLYFVSVFVFFSIVSWAMYSVPT